jgi:hypothetical protein
MKPLHPAGAFLVASNPLLPGVRLLVLQLPGISRVTGDICFFFDLVTEKTCHSRCYQ